MLGKDKVAVIDPADYHYVSTLSMEDKRKRKRKQWMMTHGYHDDDALVSTFVDLCWWWFEGFP